LSLSGVSFKYTQKDTEKLVKLEGLTLVETQSSVPSKVKAVFTTPTTLCADVLGLPVVSLNVPSYQPTESTTVVVAALSFIFQWATIPPASGLGEADALGLRDVLGDTEADVLADGDTEADGETEALGLTEALSEAEGDKLVLGLRLALGETEAEPATAGPG